MEKYSDRLELSVREYIFTEDTSIDDRLTATTEIFHSLFVPLHYERKYAYPLLIWLHGPGENEDQLKQVIPDISVRNYVAVAPRGPSTANEDASTGGYRWRQTSDDILLAEQRVFGCLESVKRRLHINPTRVFLAGFSSGGSMALRLALSHPCHFAGVISLVGTLPSGKPLLRSLDNARRLSVLLSSACEGLRYSAKRVTHDLRLLHAAGIPVTLRQYPCGDKLNRSMLADVNCWIMEQVHASDSPPADGTNPKIG